MFPLMLILVFFFAACISGQDQVPRRISLDWVGCDALWDDGFGTDSPFKVQCATLAVPLDHHCLHCSETIDLDLVKVFATKEPVLGSMLIHPGGPGIAGLPPAVNGAQDYLALSGGKYNIIGFDPRGTGRTMPFNCTSEDSSSKGVRKRGPQPLYAHNLTDELATSWSGFEEYAQRCGKAHEANGMYYGTVAQVHDVAKIVDALGEDGLLRYNGASAGTLFGWTFAALYPDRVERMILDGNINPVEYWAGIDTESVVDSDQLFENIIKACVNNADVCPLAQVGDVTTIIDKINAMLEELAQQPTADVTVSSMKTYIFSTMYFATDYPALVQTLYDVLQGDFSAFTSNETATDPLNVNNDALSAITCSDYPLRATQPSELSDLMQATEAMGSFASISFMGCYVWPFEAIERYQGSFQAKTKHPVLLVNPTWDPITPLVSAQNASATLEGSVVLEHLGNGHTTGSQPSYCTMKALRDYMVDGILPEPDSICEVDVPLFSNITAAEVYQPLYEDACAVIDGEGRLVPCNATKTDSKESSTEAKSSASRTLGIDLSFTLGMIVLVAFFAQVASVL